ncbi:MAG: hypothetical protein E7451_04755 [Ruminococcaceae bacterium]|nr:hypothetical protein [Oscillospiraceae bacterium]
MKTTTPSSATIATGILYMGVEIELDEGGESDNQARKLLEIANSETERIYCKHDGSLNDGFEVVSHPMTLAYHIEKMPWQSSVTTLPTRKRSLHESCTSSKSTGRSC